MNEQYTTRLNAGLGLIDETKGLLNLWSPGMSSGQLYDQALISGLFPGTTARRLRNIVAECFAPRFLVNAAAPARHLRILIGAIEKSELDQLLLLFTCRANRILLDFITEVYWERYAAGQKSISNDDAMAFVQRSVDCGRTQKRWEETTVRRVSAYLTGCCADYGLLERGQKRERRIIPLTMTTLAAAYLAYDLHFQGLGDNAVAGDDEWALFCLTQSETVSELKRLASKNLLMIQSAGGAIRISWKYQSMEDLCHVLAK